MKVTKSKSIMYNVVYNNENSILYTDSIDKALKMAKVSARWAEHPCVYAVYCETDSQEMKIAEYVVTEY